VSLVVLVVLVVTVGAAGALGHALTTFVRAPAPKRVGAVIAAALLAVVPGTLCRATHSLPVAMALAAAVFGACALALRGAGPRAGAGPGPGPAPVAWPAWPAWIMGAVLLALVVHGVLTRNFFDEEAHIPFALVIARGVTPPEHPLAMGQVVPYHWGIDALYAQLMVVGVSPDRAIDVVTVASMALLLCAASAFGGALMGRAGATFTTILAPLAGSPLALPLHEELGPFLVKPTMYPKEWTIWTTRPPPLTADFFQHPQGLAFPVVLVVLLLATASQRRLRMLGAFVLCLLSLVQSVHFLVMGFGFLVAALWTAWREAGPAAPMRARARAAAADVVMLFAAFVGAMGLGGFFSPSAGTSQALLWGRRFFTDANPLMLVLHHVVAFGLPLLLLPLLLTWRPLRALPERPRIALVAGATVAFVLPNVVVYPHSWDIVKLYSAAGFAAGVALALTFAAAWNSVPSQRARGAGWRAPAWRGAVALATALTVSFPLIWLCSRTVMQGRFGVPLKRDWRMREDVLAMGELVRPHVEQRAQVLVNDVDHCRMTGLFCPGFDLQRFLSGHLIEYKRAKELMVWRGAALRDLDEMQLQELGVTYALLTPRDVAKLTSAGAARLARFERVDVSLPRGTMLYRIPPPPPPPSQSRGTR
jgi:hypothetical protein